MKPARKLRYLFLLMLIGSCSSGNSNTPTKLPEPVYFPTADGITTYPANPYYWQYKGKPVLLLGGSKEDNLFQISNLKQHLDQMREVGANYIRNTMSARDDGNIQAFKILSNGKYDLNQWNEEYWNRLENLLRWTAERDIIIQIELWDQWDHNLDYWNSDPWNPDQNVNYTTENTRLKGNDNYRHVLHNSGEQHDLFLTVPELQNDQVVLTYQKKFVNKILSLTLQYDHIIYTVTNELFDQHPADWSLFWMDHIKGVAGKSSKSVLVTEMFQNNDITTSQHQVAFNNPTLFSFVDISQNSGQRNQTHWDKLQWARNYISKQPRPLNHTKIYGADEVSWTDGDEHGIERFWRNIFGGAASVRFHRPPAGIGLKAIAQTQIHSARMLLSEFNIFEAAPDVNSDKLRERSVDEAYLSYIPTKQYAVYFPAEGNIQLDLSYVKGQFKVKWLDIQSSAWSSATRVTAGKMISLQTPGTGNWVVLLTHQEN